MLDVDIQSEGGGKKMGLVMALGTSLRSIGW